MPSSLEDFLGKGKRKEEELLQEVDGGYSCQECLENVNKAYFNEEEGILIWYCTEGHRSQVTL
jgi:hypothetical protein